MMCFSNVYSDPVLQNGIAMWFGLVVAVLIDRTLQQDVRQHNSKHGMGAGSVCECGRPRIFLATSSMAVASATCETSFHVARSLHRVFANEVLQQITANRQDLLVTGEGCHSEHGIGAGSVCECGRPRIFLRDDSSITIK